jgi:hypothetical protein
MYKKKIDLKELISDNCLTEMVDGDVYQITHYGQDVKVMMTQEYYFCLMARLEKAEGTTRLVKYDPAKLMSDFESLRLSDRDFKKVEDEIANPAFPNDRMTQVFKKSQNQNKK